MKVFNVLLWPYLHNDIDIFIPPVRMGKLSSSTFKGSQFAWYVSPVSTKGYFTHTNSISVNHLTLES